MQPTAVVVSAGKNNSFGHPHRSVIDLVNKFGFQIFNTQTDGTVNLETDGLTIWKN